MDWEALILGSVILTNILMFLCFIRLSNLLDHAVQELDAKIAEAIRELVQGGLGDFEPVNPIQAALANMLTQKMTETPLVATVMDRGADGKFNQPL
jgi:hypothetical protein|tara:strand:+ start:93 stop:380 length:288 start_codon:yes stop_codon:yes gene_type:complete